MLLTTLNKLAELLDFNVEKTTISHYKNNHYDVNPSRQEWQLSDRKHTCYITLDEIVDEKFNNNYGPILNLGPGVIEARIRCAERDINCDLLTFMLYSKII